jgi:hypothetical protein
MIRGFNALGLTEEMQFSDSQRSQIIDLMHDRCADNQFTVPPATPLKRSCLKLSRIAARVAAGWHQKIGCCDDGSCDAALFAPAAAIRVMLHKVLGRDSNRAVDDYFLAFIEQQRIRPGEHVIGVRKFFAILLRGRPDNGAAANAEHLARDVLLGNITDLQGAVDNLKFRDGGTGKYGRYELSWYTTWFNRKVAARARLAEQLSLEALCTDSLTDVVLAFCQHIHDFGKNFMNALPKEILAAALVARGDVQEHLKDNMGYHFGRNPPQTKMYTVDAALRLKYLVRTCLVV